MAAPGLSPAFAWSAPQASRQSVRSLACLQPLHAVRVPANRGRALGATWQRIATWGNAPPGGSANFPLLAVALPFFWGHGGGHGSGPDGPRGAARASDAGSHYDGAPRRDRQGVGRLHATTIATLQGGRRACTVVAWCAPLPAALRGAACRATGPEARKTRRRAALRLVAEWQRHVETVLRACQSARAAPARSLLADWLPSLRPKIASRPALRAGPRQSQRAFEARVARVATALCVGRRGPQKVVLARWAALAAPPGGCFDPYALACQRRATETAAHVFCWPTRPNEAFVGSSPEALLQLRGRRVTTHAVAGTAARTLDGDGSALLASDKDRREHQLVVRRIVAALAPLCSRLRAAARPRRLATRTLWHLETPVQGLLLAPSDPLAMARRLHPTPALAGTPRRWAMARLWAEEPWRGLYGGAIGWVAPTGAHLCVAIRSAQVSRQKATLFAGAGIVAGSSPRREWLETAAKLAPMADALNQGAAIR